MSSYARASRRIVEFKRGTVESVLVPRSRYSGHFILNPRTDTLCESEVQDSAFLEMRDNFQA